MPIYEYRCESCGKELEKIQKFSDPPLTDCPDCGKSALKKLVSASSFRLKGTGWYETDFKNKKAQPAEGKDTKKDTEKEGTVADAGSSARDSTGASAKGSTKDSAQEGAKNSAKPAADKAAAGKGSD